MEPVQPPGIPGQPPEATSSPRPAEAPKGHENVLDQFPSISVAGNRIGKEISGDKKGITVKLADVFQDGQESYPDVYFRTISGNIYRLTRDGDSLKLMSAKDAGADRGVGIGGESTLDFKRELDDGSKITIGESFRWNRQTINTSRISEIVIVEPEIISDGNRLGQLPKNSIIEDFEAIVLRRTIEQKFPQISQELAGQLQEVTKNFKGLMDGLGNLEISSAFKEGNRIKFLEQTIPFLRMRPSENLDTTRRILYIAISGNVLKDFNLKDKTEKFEIAAMTLNEWIGEAQLLATKFEGDEGLNTYKYLMAVANSGNAQEYRSIMIQADTNPAVREVAKAVIYDLFVDHKFGDLENLTKLDQPLVKEVFDELETLRLKQQPPQGT